MFISIFLPFSSVLTWILFFPFFSSRIIRLLQNRQSAALSRQRKKDYVSGLEKKVHSLEQELQAAQQRIAELEDWYKLNRKEGDPELPKPTSPPILVPPHLTVVEAEGAIASTTEKENEN
jgi:hypothetical protein